MTSPTTCDHASPHHRHTLDLTFISLLVFLLLAVAPFPALDQAKHHQVEAISINQPKQPLQQQMQVAKQVQNVNNIVKLASPAAEGAPQPAQKRDSRQVEKEIVDKILGIQSYDKRIRPAGSGPANATRPGK